MESCFECRSTPPIHPTNPPHLRMLAINTSLVCLDLSKSGMRDSGIALLASALLKVRLGVEIPRGGGGSRSVSSIHSDPRCSYSRCSRCGWVCGGGGGDPFLHPFGPALIAFAVLKLDTPCGVSALHADRWVRSVRKAGFDPSLTILLSPTLSSPHSSPRLERTPRSPPSLSAPTRLHSRVSAQSVRWPSCSAPSLARSPHSTSEPTGCRSRAVLLDHWTTTRLLDY